MWKKKTKNRFVRTHPKGVFFYFLGKFDFSIVIEASQSIRGTFQENLNFDARRRNGATFLVELEGYAGDFGIDF